MFLCFTTLLQDTSKLQQYNSGSRNSSDRDRHNINHALNTSRVAMQRNFCISKKVCIISCIVNVICPSTICILPHTYMYVLPGACELLVPRLTKTCIACEHKCLGALISQCCYCNISANMHAAAFDQRRSRIG